MSAQSIACCIISTLGFSYSLTSHQLIQERIKTMNHSQSWIDTIKQQVKDKNFWQFTVPNNSGKVVILEWHMTNILSSKLAAYKKEIADLAARTTATSEVEFLQKYPEAVHQEMFLKSTAPLFAQGTDKVDWHTVEKNIQDTIKQFYCTDIQTFGEHVLKTLHDDLYFFARAIEKETGKLLGYCMLAITPNLSYGDIKLINIATEPANEHQSLESLLLATLFVIIKPHRIFTAIRSTNTQAKSIFTSLGFMVDSKPQQDQNHKLNLMYFIVMEHKTSESGILANIASRIS